MRWNHAAGLAALLALGCCTALPAQEQPSDRADLKLDRATVLWRAGSGFEIRYNGQPVFGADAADLVLHPRDWSRQLGNSANDVGQVEISEDGGKHVIRARHEKEGFRWTETLTAGPGDHLRVEYSYRQDAWDDAHVQLGFSKPVENWFAGAAFETNAPHKRADGRIPLQFDPAQEHPLDGATQLKVNSLFGVVEIATTKPVSLFDYKSRNGAFWLGLDEKLPKGQELTFAIDVRFSPARVELPGLTLSDVALPTRVDDGRLAVAATLTRADKGPERVKLSVEATAPKAGKLTGSTETALPAGKATPVRLALPVPLAGKYTYRLVIASLADGAELFASQPLAAEVLPVLTVLPGRSLYTSETEGCLLVTVAAGLTGKTLHFSAKSAAGLQVDAQVPGGKRTRVPLPLAQLPDGPTQLTAELREGETPLASATVTVRKAPPKPNEVKIDYETRGLIVDGLPWFPFGYYCIYPPGDLPDQEAPQGFNMSCAYQSEHRPDHYGEIRAYLDRCAAVGMKVHYDIREIAQQEPSDAKWAALKQEVEAFRDHPALLTWYLCDEPDGQGIPPARLIESYNLIKNLDPYHPITMVFCVPPKAPDYVDAMDIMMADPYPIPNGPVTLVSEWADSLNQAINHGMPLWIVPQAFGGGEWWAREPSAREERCMTYLALVHDATGIQYFIRRPPIGNPTSPSLWNECRQLSLETQELAPVLLSPEAAPKATCATTGIHLATRRLRGSVYVIAVNAANDPSPLALTVEGGFTGEAEVLFELRKVAVRDGKLQDLIDGFGTRVYRLPIEPPKETVTIAPGNLVVNPSFESFGNVGTPDGCYVGAGHPGASLFVDSRVAYHGAHSLRLTTPVENQGVGISPFPITLEKGRTYQVSIWARGQKPGLRFAFGLGGIDVPVKTFDLTTDWAKYEVTGVSKEGGRNGLSLRLTSAGVAWFDLMEVVPQ